MATAQDTRERQGFASSMPPNDSASDQSSGAQMSDAGPQPNSPGDPDSTFPQSGATDRSEPGTANYRPGPSSASGSNGSDTAGSGNDASADGAGAGGASDGANGGQSAGGAGTGDSGDGGNTAGGDTAAGGESAGGEGSGGAGDGSGNDSGGGLIQDAVADTQSLGSAVLSDAQSGGAGLINDVVDGTSQLVDHATGNLGLGGNGGLLGGVTGGLVPDAAADTQTLLGDALSNTNAGAGGIVNGVVTDAGNLVDHAAGNLDLGGGMLGGLPGGGIVGGVTDGIGNGIDLGNALGDGPALTAGIVGDGNGAVTQPVSDLTGGLSDGILGSPNGDGPILDLGVVGNGSPAVTGVLDGTGGDTLGGLGLGRIAEVSGAGDGNGDQDVSATVGNEPGENGPIIGAQAFGSGNPPSNNLIDIGAGPNGENSGVIANVLGGDSAGGSNPQADANLIDAGPNGQSVANADVLTSPDQFQFPLLDGAGTDALAGVLGGQDGTGPSLVPDADIPAVDIGTSPIVDVDLAGNADAGNAQNPLQTALNGQLLGTA